MNLSGFCSQRFQKKIKIRENETMGRALKEIMFLVATQSELILKKYPQAAFL